MSEISAGDVHGSPTLPLSVQKILREHVVGLMAAGNLRALGALLLTVCVCVCVFVCVFAIGVLGYRRRYTFRDDTRRWDLTLYEALHAKNTFLPSSWVGPHIRQPQMMGSSVPRQGRRRRRRQPWATQRGERMKCRGALLLETLYGCVDDALARLLALTLPPRQAGRLARTHMLTFACPHMHTQSGTL